MSRRIALCGHLLREHGQPLLESLDAHGLTEHTDFVAHIDPWNRALPGTVPFTDFDIDAAVDRGLRDSLLPTEAAYWLWDYEAPNWAYSAFRDGPTGHAIAFNRYVCERLDQARKMRSADAKTINYGQAWNRETGPYLFTDHHRIERLAPLCDGFDYVTSDNYPRAGGVINDETSHAARAIVGTAYLAKAVGPRGVGVMPALELGLRTPDNDRWFRVYCDALGQTPVDRLLVWTHGATGTAGPIMGRIAAREMDKAAPHLRRWVEGV